MERVGSFWQDKPVLVTGGTGLVGGWLTRRLLELQADVVCLVRDWVPQCELMRTRMIEKVKVVRGDVRNPACLERVLGEYEISVVFHLAAQTVVGVANRNAVSTLTTNIQGTWNLLEACRRSPCVRQIIIASSDKAYGESRQLPYTEVTPLCGRHPYDVSKSCADLIAQAFAATYGLPVAITRCGNFYGGGDLNWNRIVPGTIRSLLRGQRPVIRSTGQYIRDYFYVEDGVEAYLTLSQALAESPDLTGQAFNFSSELRLNAVDLVRKIQALMGINLEPMILGEARHEIMCQYLSAAKARQRLGWSPRFTLDEALGRTIEWYKGFMADNQPKRST